MKKNPFYSLIDYLQSTHQNISLSGNAFQDFATTLENKSYFRLPLLLSKTPIQNWVLEEAHISIYEGYDRHNALLSLYHFTGILMTNSKEKYRLHLYFNEVDALTCPPQWHRINLDESYTRTGAPADAESMTQLAKQVTLNAIKSLRQIQTNTIEQLERQYSQFEKQCGKLLQTLSFSDMNPYLTALKQLQHILSALHQLTQHDKWYRFLRYFKKHEEHVRLQPNNDLLGSIHQNPEPAIESEQPEDEESMVLEKSAEKKPIKSNRHDSVNQNVKALISDYEKIKWVDDHDELISNLTFFYQQLREVELQDSEEISIELLTQLYAIETQVEAQALRKLERALIKNEFKLANLLSIFYPLVNSKLFNLALTTRNHELLFFLITELNLPVNSLPVVIRDIQYQSPLAYCYLHHTEDKAMTDCFSVLVAAGADLMLPAREEELPLAHLLLANRSHAFYDVLVMHANMTINNKFFFQQLLVTMKSYSLKARLTEEERNNVKTSIHGYIKKIEDLNTHQRFFSPASCKELFKVTEDLSDQLHPTFLKRINTDPDIQAAAHELHNRFKELMTLFKKSNSGGQRYSKISLTTLKQDLESLSNSAFFLKTLEPGDFLSTKIIILSSFSLMQDLYNDLDNWISLRGEITSKPLHRRQANRLKREYDNLSLRILSEYGALLPTQASQKPVANESDDACLKIRR